MLPELDNFHDLLKKLDYDIERLSKTSHIYELLDCFLTLNALPEWIVNSSIEDTALTDIARQKINVMKGIKFNFDENLLHEDFDQKLRLIRLVCNHAKHKTDSVHIPKIGREIDCSFPMMFPAKFGFVISIGKQKVDAEYLIFEVTKFWKSCINLE
ncbi:hypothetical protein [Flavobacterium silvaticum]|uniref:Uncharacterized protein n=1 Tax=Flavobacterium silvaticum TaxID=1852020 RepID=A0A972FIV0_9FLAO|nr:hypothetical protein [Flavobacterium silvaticum]NMH26477.1 hypothetical protein [Flavobacterium silvaticum]